MTLPINMIGPELLFLIAVSTIAGLIRGFAGFGSGMVIVPLFSILLAPAETVAIMLLIELFATIQLLPRALRSVNWILIGQLTLPALVTIPIGAHALVNFDADAMRIAISCIVLVWASLLLFGVNYKGRISTPITVSVGAFSGAIMGAAGVGGPPVAVYLLTTRAAAETHRANIIVYFGITILCLMGVLLVNNVYHEGTVWYAIILMPFFLIATWLGSKLFERSGEQLFRRIALIFLITIGIVTLII